MSSFLARLLRDARSLANHGRFDDARTAFKRAWGGAPYGRPRRQRQEQPASFEAARYSGPEGARDYKLFVPAGDAEVSRPLVVMLHGCGQDPDDFAAGTRMNAHAQEHGVLVLYPAQAPRSNQHRCWNWFMPGDQRRGAGEPALLAAITRHVMSLHAVDPARVYVAGLSAGAAMADILAREYPDIYAAAGVHSGVPHGAAHDIASAYAAMQGRPPRGALQMPFTWWLGTPTAARPTADAGVDAVATPIIVFHGDADDTVHPRNGDGVIGALLARAGTAAAASSESACIGGRSVTRTVHRRTGGALREPTLAEHWVLHGAGHAWSGGSGDGSHVDPLGPDASREMLRFFAEHVRVAPTAQRAARVALHARGPGPQALAAPR